MCVNVFPSCMTIRRKDILYIIYVNLITKSLSHWDSFFQRGFKAGSLSIILRSRLEFGRRMLVV